MVENDLGTRVGRVLHAGSAVAQGPNVTEREIQAMLDESAASWNRGDLDGHLADNADSISFMTSKRPDRRERARPPTRCAAASSGTGSRSSSCASSR